MNDKNVLAFMKTYFLSPKVKKSFSAEIKFEVEMFFLS